MDARPLALALASVLGSTAGCALPAPAPPPPLLEDVVVTGLSLSAECVARGETFLIAVEVENREPRDGVVRMLVTAPQHGHLVNERVALAANASRTVEFGRAIGFAGIWDVSVTEPGSVAPLVRIRVVENGKTC